MDNSHASRSFTSPLQSVPSTASGKNTSGQISIRQSSEEQSQEEEGANLSKILEGVIAYVEVRSGADNRTKAFCIELQNLGAVALTKFTSQVTHVVFRNGRKSTLDKASKKGIPIVTVLWIDSCKRNKCRVPEKDFLSKEAQDILNDPRFPTLRLKRFKSMQPRDSDDDMAESIEKIRRRRIREELARPVNKFPMFETPAFGTTLDQIRFFVENTDQKQGKRVYSPRIVVPDTPPSMRAKMEEFKARDLLKNTKAAEACTSKEANVHTSDSALDDNPPPVKKLFGKGSDYSTSSDTPGTSKALHDDNLANTSSSSNEISFNANKSLRNASSSIEELMNTSNDTSAVNTSAVVNTSNAETTRELDGSINLSKGKSRKRKLLNQSDDMMSEVNTPTRLAIDTILLDNQTDVHALVNDNVCEKLKRFPPKRSKLAHSNGGTGAAGLKVTPSSALGSASDKCQTGEQGSNGSTTDSTSLRSDVQGEPSTSTDISLNSSRRRSVKLITQKELDEIYGFELSDEDETRNRSHRVYEETEREKLVGLGKNPWVTDKPKRKSLGKKLATETSRARQNDRPAPWRNTVKSSMAGESTIPTAWQSVAGKAGGTNPESGVSGGEIVQLNTSTTWTSIIQKTGQTNTKTDELKSTNGNSAEDQSKVKRTESVSRKQTGNGTAQTVVQPSNPISKDVNESSEATPWKSLESTAKDVNKPSKATPRKSVKSTAKDYNKPSKATPRKSVESTAKDVNKPNKATPRKSVESTAKDVNKPSKATPGKSGEPTAKGRRRSNCLSLPTTMNNEPDKTSGRNNAGLSDAGNVTGGAAGGASSVSSVGGGRLSSICETTEIHTPSTSRKAGPEPAVRQTRAARSLTSHHTEDATNKGETAVLGVVTIGVVKQAEELGTVVADSPGVTIRRLTRRSGIYRPMAPVEESPIVTAAESLVQKPSSRSRITSGTKKTCASPRQTAGENECSSVEGGRTGSSNESGLVLSDVTECRVDYSKSDMPSMPQTPVSKLVPNRRSLDDFDFTATPSFRNAALTEERRLQVKQNSPLVWPGKKKILEVSQESNSTQSTLRRKITLQKKKSVVKKCGTGGENVCQPSRARSSSQSTTTCSSHVRSQEGKSSDRRNSSAGHRSSQNGGPKPARNLAASEKSPGQQSPNLSGSFKQKQEVIVMTSCHWHEQDIVRALVNKLGRFELEEHVGPHTTHVVSGNVRRTLNVLRAISRGLWVLPLEWVCKSVEADAWLPEEAFEANNGFPASKLGRMEKEQRGTDFKSNLFVGQGLMFVCDTTTPQKNDIVELLELNGGRVTTCLRSADICIGEVMKADILSVNEKWVLDSISSHRPLPYAEYRLNPNHACVLDRPASPDF